MTKPMRDLRALVEKSADADLLREMIGFAAERLMDLEVGARTGAAYGEKPPTGWRRGTAIATGTGRPGPALSNCASRACAAARTFRRSSSHGEPSRRR